MQKIIKKYPNRGGVKRSRGFAFTLSEVLITLVIIGVIAAITVPSVMQNTHKQEYISKVKKAQQTLAQAVMKISMQEGAPVGDFSYMQNDDFFTHFSTVVNTAKVCATKKDGCFSEKTQSLNGIPWETYDRKTTLVTADGMAFGWDARFCSGKGLTEEDESNCIGRFIVDLNGDKTPNTFGKDIFFFAVVNDKGIVPAGSGNKSADCRKGQQGTTCAAKVLRDGKMNYY